MTVSSGTSSWASTTRAGGIESDDDRAVGAGDDDDRVLAVVTDRDQRPAASGAVDDSAPPAWSIPSCVEHVTQPRRRVVVAERAHEGAWRRRSGRRRPPG